MAWKVSMYVGWEACKFSESFSCFVMCNAAYLGPEHYIMINHQLKQIIH